MVHDHPHRTLGDLVPRDEINPSSSVDLSGNQRERQSLEGAGVND
jgi:hypothetical protein